ncbi:zinc knuckle, partial [Ancylostoma caninum]
MSTSRTSKEADLEAEFRRLCGDTEDTQHLKVGAVGASSEGIGRIEGLERTMCPSRPRVARVARKTRALSRTARCSNGGGHTERQMPGEQPSTSMPEGYFQRLSRLRHPIKTENQALQTGYETRVTQQGWTRQIPKENLLGRGHVTTKIGSFESSILSDQSEEESLSTSSRLRISERGLAGDGNQMTSYLKYIALPEVQPYSGRDNAYSFKNFLDAFELKYPRESWADLELCALFRSKLVGKAKSQYESLPKHERKGGYQVLVEAMKRECRAEQRTNKVVALGELKRLRKMERQSVSEFCVELERLTRQAYPELDERALQTERAQILYDQLVHWRDSYHLLEALESEQGAYDKLKETAKRIERRNMTLKRVTSGKPTPDRHPSERGGEYRPKRGQIESLAPTGEMQKNRTVSGKGPTCYKCKGTGHFARNCPNAENKTKTGKNKGTTSLSTRLAEAGCHMIDAKRWGEGKSATCPLFGDKMVTEVEVLGIKVSALLDTGSEISIISGNVLLRAQRNGCDIDTLVREHEIDRSKRVYDASGVVMEFITIIEASIKDRRGRSQITIPMYVSNTNDKMIILGSNALASLGYQLVCRGKPYKMRPQECLTRFRSQTEKMEGDKQRVALVSQRTYLPPSAVGWVKLTGCEQGKDWMLNSSADLIHAGVCRADDDGMVTVPVVNKSDEPIVFRAGETVGHWEEEESEWVKATANDLPTDMLALGNKQLPKTERLSKLRKLLAENRSDGKLWPRLWKIIKENNT